MSLSTINASDGDLFLSRSQVAEMFSVSPSTVTRWADDGKLPYIRTLGGHRRYVRKSILRLTDTYPREDRMESMTVDISKMYGDHHAAAVHQCVAELPGVQDVWASAAFRRLYVTFDPDTILSEAILEQLARSGYSVLNGRQGEALLAAPEMVLSQSSLRMTQTNPADL